MKFAWRTLIRNKRYAFQNLLGLVAAMTSFLLILRYTGHEKGYDQHYPAVEQLYRVTTLFAGENSQSQYATSPPPLGPLLETRTGLYEAVCRVYTWSDFTLRTEANFERPYREQNVWIVDTSFFSVFGLPLLQGDPRTALARPDNFILTYSTAVKYFGAEAVAAHQVVGQSLLGGKDGSGLFKVSGVIADPPSQSHWQYDMLLANPPRGIADIHDWGWNVLHTYVKLWPHTTQSQVQRDMHELVKAHILAEITPEKDAIPPAASLQYVLQPIEDIHLHSQLQREMRPNGNANYVRLLGWVGIGILLLAMINYLNLATAQASQRFNANGVRKLMGASRWQLVQTLLAEAFMVAGIAGLFAFLLAELLSPWFFQYFIGVPLTFMPSLLQGLGYWLGLTCSVGLLAGLFPAWYLSRINLREALQKSHTGGGKQPFRQVLVTGQMILSVGMMLASLTVFQQIKFLQNKRLGFDKEQVLVIQNDREIGDESERDAFRSQVEALPGVTAAAFSTGIPALSDFHMRDYRRPDQTEGLGIRWYQADERFAQTLDLELMAGRWFSASHPTDQAGVILNEAAMSALGLADAENAYVIKNQGAPDEARQRVVGVIRDFHYASFSEVIQPLIIEHLHDHIFKDYITVRLQTQEIEATIAAVGKIWQGQEPGVPFTSFFLDSHFDQLFQSERRLSELFSLFTVLALIIAALGLIGLAAYTAARRQKELSIRKVIGASQQDLWWLLTQGYLRLTAIALIIALPVGGWMMQQWLNQFAYRIDLEVLIFLVPALAALGLAVGVITWQINQAIRRSPVEVLRNS